MNNLSFIQSSLEKNKLINPIIKIRAIYIKKSMVSRFDKKVKEIKLNLITEDYFSITNKEAKKTLLSHIKPEIIIAFNKDSEEIGLTLIFASGSEEILSKLTIDPHEASLQNLDLYRPIPLINLKEKITQQNDYGMNWSFYHDTYELEQLVLELNSNDDIIYYWDISALADITFSNDPISLVPSIYIKLFKEINSYRILGFSTLAEPSSPGSIFEELCKLLTEKEKEKQGCL